MTIGSNIRPDFRPIGSDGTLLVADSTQAEGTKWDRISSKDILVDFTITNFSTLLPIVLPGTDVDPPEFTASYNRSASGAFLISDPDGGTNPTSMDAPNFTVGNLGFDAYNEIPNTVYTFTLQASGAYGTDTAQCTLAFLQMQYWGVSTGVLLPDSGFIKALGASGFASGHLKSFTSFAASGQYIWYAFRSAAGTPTFQYNTFYGGFTLVSTGVSFNNGFIAENYQLWRSDNPSLGTTTIGVS